jgi:predicted nuclease of predicted toxin-antitoxin system
MRVLLDENLPRRLKQHLPFDWRISTVGECGWSGKKNGELLQLAEQDFDCFLTMDRGLEYEQNLEGRTVSVVLLRAPSNRLADLLPLVPEIWWPW